MRPKPPRTLRLSRIEQRFRERRQRAFDEFDRSDWTGSFARLQRATDRYVRFALLADRAAVARVSCYRADD